MLHRLRSWFPAFQVTLPLSWLDALTSLLLGSVLLAMQTPSAFDGWLAVALVALAAPTLVQPLQRVTEGLKESLLWKSWRERVPFLLVTLAVFLAWWPISIGELPISQDHANHFLATQIFVDDLVRQGAFFGWSDRISTGLPFGDVYGTSVYLVTGLLNLLSFGLIPLEISYCFGLLLVWLIPAWAIVSWARKLGCGPWGAALAGVAFVWDIGADREGGWVYSMFHGVWPQVLATGLWLWALLLLFRLTKKLTWRRFGFATLLSGLAMWAHPMNLINFVVIAPLLLLIFWLRSESTESTREVQAHRSGFWLFLAFAFAGVIGLGWVSHVFTGARYMHQYVAYWKSLAVLGPKMWKGQLFANAFTPVGLLALVGAFVLWRRRSRLGALTLVAFVVFLVCGSMDVLTSFERGIHPKGAMFMYRRFSVSAKPLWYVMAGIGLSVIVRGVRDWQGQRWEPTPLRLFVLVLLSPLFWSLLPSSPNFLQAPVSHILTARTANLTSEMAALRRLFAEEKKRRKGLPVRVVHWRSHKGCYPLIPIAQTKIGYLPTSPPPCQTFSMINTGRNIKTMRWLGASLIVTYYKKKFGKGVRFLSKYGRFHVYRIENPARYPIELRGGGTMKVLEWTDRRKRVLLKGVKASSHLIVGLPAYSKWSAWQGENMLSWRRHRFRGGYSFSRISVEKNGEVLLDYGPTWLELLFLTLAGLVGLFCIAAGLFGDRPLPELVSDSFLHEWADRSFLMFGMLLFLIFFAFQLRESHRLTSEWGGRDRTMKAVVSFHREGPRRFVYTPKSYCARPFSRNPRAGCHRSLLKPRLHKLSRRGARIPTCLRFGIPDRGGATMTFVAPRKVTLLKGRWHGRYGLTAHLHAGKKKITLKRGRLFRIALPQGVRKFHLKVKNRRRTSYPCLEMVGLQPR